MIVLEARKRYCVGVTAHSRPPTHRQELPAAAGESVALRYEALIATGTVERDEAQLALIAQLDRLVETLRRAEKAKAAPKRPFAWLLGRRERDNGAVVRGLYVWGSVGRGKTMLMDLFFEVAPVALKRRAHFHAFMSDVHERIFHFRQRVKRGEEKDTDPIPHVAAELAKEAELLCFDEFAVTDIADAMILGRLFTSLFSLGVVVVATSNVVPDRLYEDGLNRALFLPFIALLKERMDVVKLQSRTDFRLEKLAGSPVFIVPDDDNARQRLDTMFHALTGSTGGPLSLTVKGHPVEVPCAAGGVARFAFTDLCSKPLGASDYLALAERFHTLIVENIPALNFDRRNEAKRFITLVDTLYDRHVKLLASAAAEPQNLYHADQGREAFEFDRTVSRLIEMQSEEYLSAPHGRGDSTGSGDSTGLVET
ncbi:MULTISPECIES: cell division protein ZapE [unclassified Chelatococcus]|uniref:cell division protein ZapE n=1 Tax=unclassified Chelatococcus TaxID=2638111 RepID=UPI001BCB8F54|nr:MULTISPECIES: cell division protein ZapE [unclassified Chelatococcus]CAH1655936.1 Cell division protein ZapE [Hyphomicrobiales bacterium]MBS7740456.1 AFG1 family ATPase [Chelatococcus sp. HY11]MBX3544760.1 AFG1 family ATPase [Chelatococcus sp.]MCO5078300.1 cell division protein ZapE [Chelatococcus sp.]CAH1684912.1 Cell division protein ZapE [Hyphomicrobiales bacterium]